jgi:DNA-binding LacI/PurR family transcriptional regulator
VPLTTVHYGADELSKAAVERLLELINAPRRLPRPRQTFIEPKLVVRESCGANGGRRRPRATRRAAARPASRPAVA